VALERAAEITGNHWGRFTMSTTTNDAAWPAGTVFGALQTKWRWLLALGILLLVFGTLGFVMSFAMTLATVLLFSALLIVGGGLQLLSAYQFPGWKSRVVHVVIGVLYVVAGTAIYADPVLASIALTLLVAASLLAIGVLRIAAALQLRGTPGWAWAALAGVVTALLGVIIAAQWPASGFWVIGLFVAIEMIMNGWSCVLIALSARRAAGASAA
jgi:uncharacterized membrane protein HdeD (DUF308 family)